VALPGTRSLLLLTSFSLPEAPPAGTRSPRAAPDPPRPPPAGSAFERDLTAAVGKIVKPNERFATRGFWFRLVCYCSLYAACMATYVTQGSSWALCALFGVAQACIGLNVQHDANHGALSQNPALNEFFG